MSHAFHVMAVSSAPQSNTVAVATALDACTIRLRPAWWRLAPPFQQLVLAHELAHTAQLARGGNAAVEELEEEAWAAALELVTGRLPRIQKGASQPLDAKVFVASNFPHVQSYFQHFPHEPVSETRWVTIDEVHIFNANALALFEALRECCAAQDEVVIVAHSTENGVALHLVPGCQFGLDMSSASRIVRILQSDASRQQQGIEQLGNDAQLNAGQRENLRNLVNAVRAVQDLQLRGVHFRGCRLGASASTLATFARLFSCPLVTGLDLRSFFGRMTPHILQGTPQQKATAFNTHMQYAVNHGWTVFRSDQQHQFIPDPPFGFAYETPHSAINIHLAVAVSTDAVQAFIRRYLPQCQPPFNTGPFEYHALHSIPLIFPFTFGKPNQEYALHIRSN